MRRQRLRPPVIAVSAAITALTLLAAAGCGTGSPPGGAASSAGSTLPAGSPAASTTGAASPTLAAGCGAGAWLTAPAAVVRHVRVPPVPVVTAVRTARHPECGYDRLVLDFSGPVPGYAIRYVSTITADPSGRTVVIPGRRYLLIVVREAQAHTAAGVPTVTRLTQVPGYPVLASWALAGDFEGVVTLAVGLTGTARVRVGELPGRLYFDFRP